MNSSWHYVASMQTVRTNLFVASHAGKLWAIGGKDSEYSDVTSVEVYDPEVNLWSDVQMPLKSFKGNVIGCTISCPNFNQD